MEDSERTSRAARRDFLSVAEIGPDSRDGDLARIWRRFQDPPYFPWLHAAGDPRRI